ncbi:MAG: hypothetical protein A2156_00830 [Deltaproteobacteria bacterium RBG_16_48_10]|nr:MAG: hypothetical protein A2156_00830 [Deltaproteobacteria bacterium RBG_16_48_10]
MESGFNPLRPSAFYSPLYPLRRCEKIPKSTDRTGSIGKIVGRLPYSGSTIRMKKRSKIAKLRWFVTLTISMSASYDFGDTPCSVSHLPIVSHLLSLGTFGDPAGMLEKLYSGNR